MTNALFGIARALGLLGAAATIAACSGSSGDPTSTSTSDALKHHKGGGASSSSGSETCGCDNPLKENPGGTCDEKCSDYGYTEGECQPGFGTAFYCNPDGCIVNVSSCDDVGGGSSPAPTPTPAPTGTTPTPAPVSCPQGDIEIGNFVATCADEGLKTGQCVNGEQNGGEISWTCQADGCAYGYAGTECPM